MNKINVCIKSMKKNIYNGTANIVVMKTIDGEIGVMANHIPMITILEKSQIKIKDGINEFFFDIESGTAKIFDNKLVIINFN